MWALSGNGPTRPGLTYALAGRRVSRIVISARANGFRRFLFHQSCLLIRIEPREKIENFTRMCYSQIPESVHYHTVQVEIPRVLRRLEKCAELINRYRLKLRHVIIPRLRHQ